MKSLILLILTTILAVTSLPAAEENTEMNVQNDPFFVQNPEELRWRIVNDTVMGGVSDSTLEKTASGTYVFKGNLSLENNGGFASVRTMPFDFRYKEVKAFKIRVRGDGQTYQLRFRTNDRWDGVSYRADFSTKKNEWVEVVMPIEDFKPTFRGRIVRDAPPLAPEKIRQAGFMISDKQDGSFELEIASVIPQEETPATKNDGNPD